jgi:hypothetical protein
VADAEKQVAEDRKESVLDPSTDAGQPKLPDPDAPVAKAAREAAEKEQDQK